MRLAQRSGLQKPGDASAAGGIGLQNVHRSRLQHAAKITGIIAILTGGDLHLCRRPVTHEAQSFQIIRRNRLFEPAHAVLRKTLGRGQRLLAAVGAVGVHEQFSVVADGFACSLHAFLILLGMGPDFHLDQRNALIHPAF